MKESLSKLNAQCLWHFTDRANYASIAAEGLLSWRELSRRGVTPPLPGGNDWSHDADKHIGVDDYVHLAFSKQHPMLFIAKREERIKDAIWLRISLSVLDIPGIRYTQVVSNQSGAELLDSDQAKRTIDLAAIFTFIDFKIEGNQERKHAAEKGEILVPVAVPPHYIIGYENG